MDDWTPEMDEAFNEIEKQSNLGKQILKEIEQDWRKNASEYERGFIDGMQKQMQSSVDRAVNAMGKREWVGLIRGVRVEGDTVIVHSKNNDEARYLCHCLIHEMEMHQEKNT